MEPAWRQLQAVLSAERAAREGGAVAGALQQLAQAALSACAALPPSTQAVLRGRYYADRAAALGVERLRAAELVCGGGAEPPAAAGQLAPLLRRLCVVDAQPPQPGGGAGGAGGAAQWDDGGERQLAAAALAAPARFVRGVVELLCESAGAGPVRVAQTLLATHGAVLGWAVSDGGGGTLLVLALCEALGAEAGGAAVLASNLERLLAPLRRGAGDGCPCAVDELVVRWVLPNLRRGSPRASEALDLLLAALPLELVADAAPEAELRCARQHALFLQSRPGALAVALRSFLSEREAVPMALIDRAVSALRLTLAALSQSARLLRRGEAIWIVQSAGLERSTLHGICAAAVAEYHAAATPPLADREHCGGLEQLAARTVVGFGSADRAPDCAAGMSREAAIDNATACTARLLPCLSSCEIQQLISKALPALLAAEATGDGVAEAVHVAAGAASVLIEHSDHELGWPWARRELEAPANARGVRVIGAVRRLTNAMRLLATSGGTDAAIAAAVHAASCSISESLGRSDSQIRAAASARDALLLLARGTEQLQVGGCRSGRASSSGLLASD